ncbi:MAG: response regulator [Smithellaceae bacterium]|nr:response regulator [Smithellaceae bacterium]
MTEPQEIVKSSVSVYEIELDLSRWEYAHTGEAPRFSERLFRIIPLLKDQRCLTAKSGTLAAEVESGTSFAHVIEHVIIELIRLADPEKELHAGWTREKADRPVYVVHYTAPDFLTGRLAAILAVDLVKRVIREEEPVLSAYVELMKNPLQYFTQDDAISATFTRTCEPLSVIREIRGGPGGISAAKEEIGLTDVQMEDIRTTLKGIRRHLPTINDAWRNAFLEYSGSFGRSIIDKVELINIDKFIDSLVLGHFHVFYRGVTRAAQLIGSYRIPPNFLTHSLWLYKNKLLNYFIEEYRYQKDKATLDRIIKDFEDFFRVILQRILLGYVQHSPVPDEQELAELTKFCEVSGKKGCILIVDDDEMIRITCLDILEYEGYRVILAKDGSQARDALARRKDEITLVILDLMLPGESGEEIFSQLRAVKPDLKVLVMTGYSHLLEGLQVILAHEGVDFIQKPFSAEGLLRKVRTVLE